MASRCKSIAPLLKIYLAGVIKELYGSSANQNKLFQVHWTDNPFGLRQLSMFLEVCYDMYHQCKHKIIKNGQSESMIV